MTTALEHKRHLEQMVKNTLLPDVQRLAAAWALKEIDFWQQKVADLLAAQLEPKGG